jgi:hypothetical protein
VAVFGEPQALAAVARAKQFNQQQKGDEWNDKGEVDSYGGQAN